MFRSRRSGCTIAKAERTLPFRPGRGVEWPGVPPAPAKPAKPAKPGLRRDAQRNRDRIIAATRAAFQERGLEVGVDEIARRAPTEQGVEAGVRALDRIDPGTTRVVEELRRDDQHGDVDEAR